MVEIRGKVVLITGASSGIGEAVARLFADKGAKVILVARRKDKLATVCNQINERGGTASFMVADLAQTSTLPDLICASRKVYGRIDILVNNAGMAWYGYLRDMPGDILSDMIGTHVSASSLLTTLLLPEMKEQGYGHIINMSSIAGEIPSQGIVIYAACKAYMTAFSTALYRELKGSPVRVSTILPGPVKTDLSINSKSSGGRLLPTDSIGVSSEDVARKVLHAVQYPHRLFYVPWILGITPVIEHAFGWLIDLIGPALLRREDKRA